MLLNVKINGKTVVNGNVLEFLARAGFMGRLNVNLKEGVEVQVTAKQGEAVLSEKVTITEKEDESE